MKNLELYNKVREVPTEAKKNIGGGRLKGMTDINPMWRIKTLTEQFGPVGFGWYYNITNKEIIRGGNDEQVAIVDIEMFIKMNDEWSKPIAGTGGSAFVTKERNGLYTSDEAFKMALTDALSVSCKALGIGADVYFEKDKTKYNAPKQLSQLQQDTQPNGTNVQRTQQNTNMPTCVACNNGVAIPAKVANFSLSKYGKVLCMKHQEEFKNGGNK